MKFLFMGALLAGSVFHKADTGDNPAFSNKKVGELSETEFREGLATGFDQIGERQRKVQEGVDTVFKDHKALGDRLETALTELKNVDTKNAEAVDAIGVELRKIQRAGLLRARGETEADYGINRFRKHEEACAVIGKAFRGADGKGMGATSVEIMDIATRGETETNTSGQAILNPELTLDIYDTLLSFGSFRDFDNRRMASRQQKLIVKTSRPVAYWIPESGEYIPSSIGLASLFLTAGKIGVYDAFSREMVQDSPIEIGALVLDDFAQACAARMDYSVYLGDGTNDAGGINGGITGIANAGTVVAAAATHTTIQSMSSDDFLKPLLALERYALKKRPEWRTTGTSLAAVLGVKGADGRPVFQDAFQAPSYGAIGSIFGFPVKLAEILGYNNAAGGVVATFGDPSAVAVGIRSDFDLAFSDDVYFSSNQRAYRGTMRGTAALKRPGAQVVLKTAAA